MKRIFTFLSAACILMFAFVHQVHAQWSTVGSAGISSSVANYTATTVDNSGNVYIAYSDNNAGNKLTVRKYNGSSWSTVGSAGISGGSVEYVSIATYGSTVYVAYKDWNKSGKVTLKSYNGSSWSTVGSEGFSTSSVFYVSLAVSSTGIPVVAYQDQAYGGRVTVKGYTNNNWVTLEKEGFTNVADYVDLCIDGSDNVYVAYRDNGNWYKARVMKYDLNNNNFSTYGSSSVSSGNCADIKLAADDNGVVYISYKDQANNNKVTVKKYDNGSWATVGTAGFSAGGVGTPAIAIDRNNTPFVVYRDDNNTQKATVMTYNGTNWTAVGGTGVSASVVDYTAIAIDPANNDIYIAYKDNSVSQKATVLKHAGTPPAQNTWDGSSSTSWNTAANWSMNSVPTSSQNVKIPSGLSRYPSVTSGTASCKNITIISGGSVTISGGKIEIAGTISNSGTFDVTNGTVVLNGNTAQTIPSGAFKDNTVKTLELDNSAGCTLADTVKILSEYKPTSGKLTTNDKLVLRSTASGTARISAGHYQGNYISGKVTVEQYIAGGRRAFRFLAHPFGHAIALSQLMDDIDITGQGGAQNGFTPVAVNTPSAYYFDVTTADNSTYGNNPGWKDFISTGPAYWDPNEMARVFVRGSKGQGLVAGAYTPNAVTLDMTGEVMQGDRFIGVGKGNNSKYVIIGNPYASPVDMSATWRWNLSSNFCVWDPRQGTNGGYTSYQFSSGYILPAYGAFVTEFNTSWSNIGYFSFEESDKSGATPGALFKGTANRHELVLKVEDSSNYWDRLTISFDTVGMAVRDTFDMKKLNNPDIDFFTFSADRDSLSIDVRPFKDGEVIDLALTYAEEKRYVLKVENINLPADGKLYLVDKFLNKKEELKPNFEYWFDVTADTNSQGGGRFAINAEVDSATAIAPVQHEDARMQLIPNPAHNTVKVSFDRAEGMVAIRMTNVSGQVVYSQHMPAGVGSVVIPVADLPNGVYMVELQSRNTRLVEKLVKH